MADPSTAIKTAATAADARMSMMYPLPRSQTDMKPPKYDVNPHHPKPTPTSPAHCAPHSPGFWPDGPDGLPPVRGGAPRRLPAERTQLFHSAARHESPASSER
ncbi:hypothetical protein T484DRAFT_2548308 [Baffinella frigidus]|nr:hypothetical protein T484DRAFT_2548308 [Cryptophyta sp. CCMP2293]